MPTLLQYQLNRIRWEGTIRHKILSNTSFPEEFDVSACYTGSMDQALLHTSNPDWAYQLVAVVAHQGQSLNCGHYVCYVRPQPGQWMLMNDSRVDNVTFAEVQASLPYLLFYAQSSTEFRAAQQLSRVPQTPIPS